MTEGETVAAPAAMTKTGYTFDGWYTDAALTGKAAFPYAVTADVTLHAKWTAEAVEEEPQIELPNDAEKEQQAFADDETTGGFTFTAKSAWTATVTETGGSTRASNVAWLRLLFDGEETYSGAAGSFTLVIELDENYSGETRTATITIKSGGDTITITVTQDGKTEEGVVPVEPGKPVPDGMRYVSRIDADYSYIFEYDSKNNGQQKRLRRTGFVRRNRLFVIGRAARGHRQPRRHISRTVPCIELATPRRGISR